jgi:hypothetical protein
MKKIFFAAMAIIVMAFTACNSNGDKTKDHDMAGMKRDSVSNTVVADDKDIKTVAVTYSNVDAKVAVSIKEIIDHYLHIKNALVDANATEAASGGKAMESAISKIDKSLFTAEQKTAFDEVSDNLKERAEHINKSKIDHQREQFSMMSEDVYTLAKAFGGGRPLYHDHCPMYNDNKGAMWLSEIKEVKNPYYGSEMLTCGKVEEIIK